MIKAQVFRDGIQTNGGQFQSQEEAEAWVAYHQFSGEIVYTDVSAELEQARINAEARAYLAATDWYCIRHMENGADIPEDVLEARQDARDRIVD